MVKEALSCSSVESDGDGEGGIDLDQSLLWSEGGAYLEESLAEMMSFLVGAAGEGDHRCEVRHLSSRH